jgi:hypothetical protein
MPRNRPERSGRNHKRPFPNVIGIKIAGAYSPASASSIAGIRNGMALPSVVTFTWYGSGGSPTHLSVALL